MIRPKNSVQLPLLLVSTSKNNIAKVPGALVVPGLYAFFFCI